MTLLDQFDGETPEEIDTETEPVTCINCGTYAIEETGVDASAGVRSTDIRCTECGTTWRELYLMALITNIEIGSK